MEFFRRVIILACVLILLVTTRAFSLSPQAYWNVVFPNTPMPRALENLIKPEGWKNNYNLDDLLPSNNGTSNGKVKPDLCDKSALYVHGASLDKVRAFKGIDQYFFEGDLRKGKNLNLQISGAFFMSASFLPRENVEGVPFSSKKIPDILNHYSVKSNSSEAYVIEEIIEYCENPGIPIEERFCATSLESMIDNCTSMLGKNIYALSTELERETHLQRYNISRITKIPGDAAVSCHQLRYVHPVFYCHNTGSVRLYEVSMVGVDDGTKMNGVVVCHNDTSYWNPKHLAFQLLKVKPGTVPVCHVLNIGHVLWISK